jgi:predicted NACHT family NTPase
VRFVGFADHRPRPNVQVPELFVPLRLETRDEKKKGWTTKELVDHLLDKPADGKRAARVAVLGDPGSGKTTLCRFAAVVIAGETDCEGLRVTDEILPLFLPFRDYVRVCRETNDRSLVEYLEEQARAQLQVAVPEGFLEASLDDGRAVLLLDGLDEVGSPEDRVEMRGRVQAFCRLYPRTPVLVTSRFAGYEDAPLPRQGPEAFVHLGLASFDDDDLRRFVTSWYAVQEANDPVARDRGAADLVAALEADARVRKLARNPMLATLIALVHRYEAHLPGERAALYDICVKTGAFSGGGDGDPRGAASRRLRLFPSLAHGVPGGSRLGRGGESGKGSP